MTYAIIAYILIVESEDNYMNTILYIGLGLMLLGFFGFIISIIMESYCDKKLHRQKQLTESFKNADKTNKREYNDTY